jgi:hypothetical protein
VECYASDQGSNMCVPPGPLTSPESPFLTPDEWRPFPETICRAHGALQPI